MPTDGPVGLILDGTGRYSWRPAHLHYLAYKDGYQTIQTELFNSDSRHLDSDAVFGVKQSPLVPYTLIEDSAAAAEHGFNGPFYEGHHDFVMKDDASVIDTEKAYSPRASMSS